MRRRKTGAGLTVNAIAGCHVVMLGLNIAEAGREGLRGFAISRTDPLEQETYWIKGTKTFKAVEPFPAAGEQFSSLFHPFQSFQWADYSAKPDRDYSYEIVPMYGAPGALAHANRIRGLLMTQGIVGFVPHGPDVERELHELITGDGRALGARLREEIRRESVRLRLVTEQLEAVNAERDAVALAKQAEPSPADTEQTRLDASMIASLTRIKGVGPNDASVLVREAFWRNFANRRQVAAWSGFAPTPWASGKVSRDQGIGKSGPAAFRSNMLQIAWRWLRWQPNSQLSQWFNERTNGATGRMRRIMIVALARKLLIALWRYATAGLVPTGAVVA